METEPIDHIESVEPEVETSEESTVDIVDEEPETEQGESSEVEEDSEDEEADYGEDDEPEEDPEDDDPVQEFHRMLEASRAMREEANDPGDEQPEQEADFDPGVDATTVSGTWQAIKAEIQETWEGMEGTENERRLVDFLDRIVPSLDKLTEFQAAQEQRALETEASFYAFHAQAAADAVREEYGLEVQVTDMLGFAQYGGLKAYAALHGMEVEDLQGKLTKDVFLQIFELKNRDVLRRIQSAPKAPVKKQAPKPLTSGGGARESRPPADDREAFRRARREASALRG